MNLKLRAVEDREQALSLSELLEQGARESMQAYRDEEPPAGAAARFLERYFDSPETLLVVAENADEKKPLAFCLTAPLEDPWTQESWALIVALWVAPKIRHRGVARALVQETTRLLARREVHTISARTGHNDDSVISMGERWGFVRAWEFLVRER